MASVLPGGTQEIPDTTFQVPTHAGDAPQHGDAPGHGDVPHHGDASRHGDTPHHSSIKMPSAPSAARSHTRSSTGGQSTISELSSLRESHLSGATPDETLWAAVKIGDLRKATEALNLGANPNMVHIFEQDELRDLPHAGSQRKNATQLRRKWYTGPVVTAAVMRGELDMVKLLAERKAALTGAESHYKFAAGLRKVEFRGPPTFANTKGDPKLAKALVMAKANLLEKAFLEGKENNTLLWHCSYSNHKKMVQWLLDNLDQNCHDHLEQACYHQDDGTITHTPLHISSRQGHVEVVRILLHRGAKFKKRNEAEMTPLTEAIESDHTAVVRELVRNLADPLSTKYDNAAHVLFVQKNNMVTIEAAADGLRRAMLDNPTRFEDMYFKGKNPKFTLEHVVKFLRTPGDAMVHIMIVIFQKRTLKYCMPRVLENGSEISQRRAYKNAHIPPNTKFNVTVGPDVAYWNKVFEEQLPRASSNENGNSKSSNGPRPRAQFESKERKFISTLLPQQEVHHMRHRREKTIPMQVPIDIYQCVLPGIHKNPEVLFAITEQEGDAVFKANSIQAIVELGWLDIRFRYNLHLVNSVTLVMLLFYMAYKINTSGSDELDTGSNLAIFAMYFCWVWGLKQELGQIVGHYLLGRLDGYVSNLWNYVDWLRLAMTLIVITMLWRSHKEFRLRDPDDMNETYTAYRTLFAVVVFFRWMRVLNAMRGYKAAGQEMLPILRAFEKTYPFLGVVVCPFLGFVHGYYCMGVYGLQLDRSLFIVYRLGFVGDFDVEELEDVEPWYDAKKSWREMQDPERTHWFTICRIFMVGCSLFLTVAMMNIFIGVLGDAYMEARKNNEEIFWRTRARIVFDELALREAEMRFGRMIRTCFCSCIFCSCLGGKAKARIKDEAGLDNHAKNHSSMSEELETPAETVRDDDGVTWEHVWYCCQAEGAGAAADGVIDDSGAAVTQKDFDEMREQLNTTVTKLNNVMNKQHHQVVDELHRINSHMDRPQSEPGMMRNTPGLGRNRRASEPQIRVIDADSGIQSMHVMPIRAISQDSNLNSNFTAESSDGNADAEGTRLGFVRSVPFAAGSHQALVTVQQKATDVAESAWAVVEGPLKKAEDVALQAKAFSEEKIVGKSPAS